jgi:predicted PurR-regulated permease PerM
MLAIWEMAVAKTGGYIYSRLLLAAASGLAHLIILLVLGVPFALPLALWIGVTSAFVPVVGTYLGGILALLVALVNQPIDALWLAIFIGVYQQVENYALAPAVQSRTMDVHPAVAFLAVLVGGTLLGAPGALLALPATAIIQALLSTYVRRHELIAELGEVTLPDEPVDRKRPEEITP